MPFGGILRAFPQRHWAPETGDFSLLRPQKERRAEARRSHSRGGNTVGRTQARTPSPF